MKSSMLLVAALLLSLGNPILAGEATAGRVLEPVHEAVTQCTVEYPEIEEELLHTITIFVRHDSIQSARDQFALAQVGAAEGTFEYNAVILEADPVSIAIFDHEKKLKMTFTKKGPNHIGAISASLTFRGSLKWNLEVNGQTKKGTLWVPVLYSTGEEKLEPRNVTCKVDGEYGIFIATDE